MITPENKEHLATVHANIKEKQKCWIWTGKIERKMPVFKHPSNKFKDVRRFLLELQGEELNNWNYFTQTCNNALCVNPDHQVKHRHTRDKSPDGNLTDCYKVNPAAAAIPYGTSLEGVLPGYTYKSPWD